MQKLEELKQLLRAKKELKIKNDIEYSFLVGQLAHYIQERQNRSNSQLFINKFLTQKTAKGISNILVSQRRMTKLSTSNYLDYVLKEITKYSNFKKLDQGMVIAGYLGENLIKEVD